MKECVFDIAVILMTLVVTGVTTNHVTAVEQPATMWTLEEASFLGGTTFTQSADHGIVQAVTRQNEGDERFFRCGIHSED